MSAEAVLKPETVASIRLAPPRPLLLLPRSPGRSSQTLELDQRSSTASVNSDLHSPVPECPQSVGGPCNRTSRHALRVQCGFIGSSTSLSREQGRKEGELTLGQVLSQGNRRLRLVECGWEGCDALLGSLSLLRQHLHRRHCEDARRAARQENNPKNIHLALRCRWKQCTTRLTYRSQADLEYHIRQIHILPLASRYCPFKACLWPNLTALQASTNTHHTTIHGEPPYRFKDLRSSPRQLVRDPPKIPPPINREWTATVSPFPQPILSPYTPRQSKVSSQPHLRRFLSGSRGSTTSSASAEPIVPDRSDPDVYFWPMLGDAPSGYNYAHAVTSSIFRHPRYHHPDHHVHRFDGGDVLRMQMKTQVVDVEHGSDDQNMSSPFDELAPPGSRGGGGDVRARPRSPYPILLVDAGYTVPGQHIDRKRKLERDTSEGSASQAGLAGSKGSAQINVALDLDFEILDRLPADKVVRASSRLAARMAGTSIGVRYWKYRQEFERCGRELSEFE